ncbi:MAG: hydroxymethylbilane synthase [Caldilineaceae bacterium]
MPSATYIMPITLRLGSRTSPLALWQTHHIIARLQAVWSDLICEITPFSTQGDKTQQEGKPLPAIGGKGVFTAELEEALLAGTIDLAVHSLKDLPVEQVPGVTLGAITSRADVRDVLIARQGCTLATLPIGAKVGTSSTRRAAQLRTLRSDLIITSIRGNIETRIRKVTSGEYDATLLALAGVERLALNGAISEILSVETMLPAPGQGALGVQCRSDDPSTLNLLAAIDDIAVKAAVTAERTFLATLGGGCAAPIAAYAHLNEAGNLQMQGLVAATDGSQVVKVHGCGDPSEERELVVAAQRLGQQLAERAIAKGADRLLGAMRTSEPSLPLAGKRILITRQAERAQSLVDGLHALGATPLLMPLIEIVPTDDWQSIDHAIQALEHYDWLVFTSVNGVEIFFQRAAEIGVQLPQQHKIAAVGETTAQALVQLGQQVDLTPEQANAEALAHAMGNLVGKRILLPQAAIAKRAFADSLEAAGAEVTILPIYQTLPLEMSDTMCAELEQGVDAIVVSSGSTARSLVQNAEKAGLRAQVEQSALICIGPVTAQAAQALGLRVAAIADEQTNEGLLQAILKLVL